jgi:hypothetical protein
VNSQKPGFIVEVETMVKNGMSSKVKPIMEQLIKKI